METDYTIQPDELITLTRRISEIMEERGKAFSIQGMASRLGINRETLRMMLSGKRDIYDFELKQIAEIFDISVERLTRADSKKKIAELYFLLKETTYSEERSLAIAKELHRAAIGLTERCIALMDLGRAYYKQEEYVEAHKYFVEAHDYALQLQEKYNESKWPYYALRLLELSCTARKDFSNIHSYLSKSVPALEGEPQWAAYNRYFLAKVSEELKSFEEARTYYYESIQYSVESGHAISIGRSKLNTANFEVRQGQPKQAVTLYKEALQHLEEAEDLGAKLVCRKEYGKCLVKLGQAMTAVDQARIALEEIKVSLDAKILKLEPKFYLLLARAEDNPNYAIHVLESENTDIKVKNIACKYLIDYYAKLGDGASVIKYYLLSNDLINPSQYDILHEEEF